MHWRKISDKKNFEKAAPVSNSCKQSSVSQLCTGSGYACWWPNLWLQKLQLGPPKYWQLERAQTWVSTEGGRIQPSVDKRVGATRVQRSRVRIPVPARFFDAKFFLFKSYSRHFRHFYWWLPFAKLITTKRARGRAELKKEQPVYEPKISSLCEMELDRNET